MEYKRRWILLGIVGLAVFTGLAYKHAPKWTTSRALYVSNEPGSQSHSAAADTKYNIVDVSLKTDSLPVYNVSSLSARPSVDELTKILSDRLALPNSAQRIIYNTPCKPNSRELTGCTSQCPNAPSLDSKPLRERVSSLIESPHLQLSEKQRVDILSIASKVPETDVIIVSASSSNHYAEMQAMFENLHTVVYPIMAEQKRNFSVVMFDLGLTAEQRKMTEEKCKCQVLTFPAHLFPPHVKDNHCYSWKPLIIRSITARARKHIVWQDASIRWTKDFLKIFDNVPRYGHQIIRYMISSRVTANTLKQMFDYIKEDVCPFFPYPEVQASVQLHANDPLVVNALMDPWSRCALEKNCICPVSPPGSVLGCSKTKIVHRCHRFDQSALSIFLAKLYAADMYKVMAPETSFMDPQIVAIKREHTNTKYFTSI